MITETQRTQEQKERSGAMTVRYEEYRADKDRFFKKHIKANWNCDTSPMDQYGVYYKTYCFSDGAVWYERMAPVWRKAEATVEVEGATVKIEQDVKLFETEFWHTDSHETKKYYEKF